MRRSNFGKRGGEGPTRGKKSRSYIVTLPDGTTVTKRTFEELTDPVGYAYLHEGVWYVAAVRERSDASMAHCTVCPVKTT